MVIDNVFVTDISETRQTVGVFLKENASSDVVYVIEHQYDKGTSDADVKAAIQAKMNAFVIPVKEGKRLQLTQDLLTLSL